MPNDDREVFEYLIAGEDTQLQQDFLTYAVFAHEKREWISAFRERLGREPDQAEINNWVSNLTDWNFQTMRAGADGFFVEAAEVYFTERLEEERKKILNSAIIKEVKAAGSFWKQVALALITAILAPLILGGIIALAILGDKTMFTPGSVADRLKAATDKPVIAEPPKPDAAKASH